MRSWFFLSSSIWKASSLERRSDFWKPFVFSLVVAQLHLKISDTGLQFGHSSSSAPNGILICIVELVLKLGELSLESTLGLPLGVGVVLLSAELICQTSSIHHCLLGLLLRVFGLLEHVVDFSVHCVYGTLNGTLIAGSLGVDGSHLVDSVARLGELGLSLPLAPLCGVEQRSS